MQAPPGGRTALQGCCCPHRRSGTSDDRFCRMWCLQNSMSKVQSDSLANLSQSTALGIYAGRVLKACGASYAQGLAPHALCLVTKLPIQQPLTKQQCGYSAEETALQPHFAYLTCKTNCNQTDYCPYTVYHTVQSSTPLFQMRILIIHRASHSPEQYGPIQTEDICQAQ